MKKSKVLPFAVGYIVGSFIGIPIVLGFLKAKSGGKF